MYFRADEIDAIFSSIARMMHRFSRFWFDFVSEDLIHDTTDIKSAEIFMENMRKMGEPFINGYNNTASLAKAYRLEVEENTASGEVLGMEEEIYNHYSFCILKGG